MKLSKKAYTDNQNKWLLRLMNAEIKSIRQAVDKVETTNESAVSKLEKTSSDYRASQNEWRGQIKDQTNTFVTRRELWGAVVAIIAIVTSIMAVIIKM
jgi:hypothetical protein